MAVTRKQFLKTAAAAPLGAVSLGGGAAQTTGGARPNVLILMSDQHRPDRNTGPPAIFAEWALGSAAPQYTVRTRSLKYIYTDGDIDELYDLEADPGENVNRARAAAMKKVRDEMHDRLFAWYDPAKSPYRQRGAQ